MATLRHDINIARETLLAVPNQDKALDEIEYLAPSADQPVRWSGIAVGAQGGQE